MHKSVVFYKKDERKVKKGFHKSIDMDTAKRPKLRVPAVASFYYLSASVVAKGVSLLTTPVFTRLMSAEEYGEYTLYVSWIAILSVFSTLEIGGNVMNRSLLGADEKRDATVFSACSLSLLNSTAFLVLATVFSSLFSIITGLGSEMLFLLCLQMICDGVVSIILASERFRYSYKRVFVFRTVTKSKKRVERHAPFGGESFKNYCAKFYLKYTA